MQLASEATPEEKQYMNYLDEVKCEDFGRLLFQGDPIAFQVGFNDWELEQEKE